MKVGFVGLGKLGLPLAVAIGQKHQVFGYDVDPAKMRKRRYENKELGPTLADDFQDYFDKADLTFCPLERVVQESEIVFVAVQTPHGPEYEGITRVPVQKADFDYTYLRQAAERIAPLRRPRQLISVISTVLPGTMRREVLPLIPDCLYTPAFPAMGTVLRDFLYPEFVLVGREMFTFLAPLFDLYASLLENGKLKDKLVEVSIESAELAKCAYNLMISARISCINTFMEVAHKTPGCNIDEVSNVLSRADRRICSSAYMHGGMGDSGPCHPRDCTAMSWLAGRLNLSYDFFKAVMHCREFQTEWLAELIREEARKRRLPVVILGKSYKPETNITTGSCAVLLANLLKEMRVEFSQWDPFVDSSIFGVVEPALFFVATQHDCWKSWKFPPKSVVIDPFRYLSREQGFLNDVQVIHVGVGGPTTADEARVQKLVDSLVQKGFEDGR